MSLIGDVLVGLFGGYFLGLLGMGSGLAFVKCLSNLRYAMESKNFDLSFWIPTVLMMMWWGLITLVFFGAPVGIGIENPEDLSGDRVLIRTIAFYFGSFIFIRSVLFHLKSVIVGEKKLRDRIRNEL